MAGAVAADDLVGDRLPVFGNADQVLAGVLDARVGCGQLVKGVVNDTLSADGKPVLARAYGNEREAETFDALLESASPVASGFSIRIGTPRSAAASTGATCRLSLLFARARAWCGTMLSFR